MLQGLSLLIHAACLKFIGVVLHVTSHAVTLLLLCLAVQLSAKELVPVWLLQIMLRLLQATVNVTHNHAELTKMHVAAGKICRI